MKMSNFDRNYFPGNRHMICIGKTKTTSEKCLFNACVNAVAFRCIVYLFFLTRILLVLVFHVQHTLFHFRRTY